MPNPTKPATNLTREEHIDQSPAEVYDDLAVNNTMRLLGFTWDGERQWWFNQDNVWLYQGAARNLVQSVDTYTQAKEREARLNELGNADIAMDSCGINEMEEWEDYYKERTAELTSGKEESMLDTVLAIDTVEMTNEEKKLINDNLFELL